MLLTTITTKDSIVVLVAYMSTLTRTVNQEALDAASLDLKQWTAILSFVLLSLDKSGASVDSEIPDLLEFLRPM